MLGQTFTQSRCTRPSSVSVQALFGKKKPAPKKEQKPVKKQGFLSGITEALDFAQVRSDDDRDLIDRAKLNKNLGKKGKKGQEREKMSRQQYQALRRKVGGTAKDYWKDFVEADETEARRSSGVSVPTGLPFLLAIVLGVVVATVVVAQGSPTTSAVAQSDPVPTPSAASVAQSDPEPTPSAGQTDSKRSPPADVAGSASVSVGAAGL